MALPPVNIPNVNYGSYARPEQVRVDVRGQMAIGQAIAQGFQAAANYVNQKAEANRKLEQEAAKETKQDTKELTTEFKTANALQNTNVLREISADLADINMQATKDPSLNFTLEKQNMFGVVDNINILENDILDKLPEDLTRNDFVNRDAWEKYSSLLRLKNNEMPLEYDKSNKDLIVYISGKKNNLRDLMDKKGALDYTSGLKYKIENNPTIDKLGSEFNKIAENYIKVENGVKKLDYNRAAAVIGDFPLIKDIVKEFGENIYNGYLRGDGEPYDPTNKDQLAEVQTLIIDRALASVPKDFGDAPPVPVEKAEDIQTRKSNDYIVKTPITDEQWNSVIKTDGNKSMANISSLVSSYGFSLVGSPIASESGESEIGYNIKDNITNKTIKIFKSDTPQQVRKKMADLRGIDIYSSFVTQ
jgi:hypothetical protein